MTCKVAGLTPVWNEESCVVFVLASLLPFVDFYVLADSGSDDQTLPLVRHFFDKEIKSGKLHILEYGRLEDFDISKPKNAAIDIIREAGCEQLVRLDGDDVFYPQGARDTVEIARVLPKDVARYTINHWELYQYRAKTTLDFLNCIEEDILKQSAGPVETENPNFMCLRIPPGNNPHPSLRPKRYEGSYGHARIYRVDGAVSKGAWTDEAQGNPGEDIFNTHGGRTIGAGGYAEWIVHYGWARPLDKKLSKTTVWVGEDKKEEDIRVNRIHEVWPFVKKYNMSNQEYGDHCWPHRIVFPFNKHPAAVQKYVHAVADFLKETQ